MICNIMAIVKKKVSETRKATTTKGLIILGVELPTNDNVHADMELLRGNTASAEWIDKNPGKTYEDYISLLQQPAKEMADEGRKQYVLFETAEEAREQNEVLRQSRESSRENNEIERKKSENTRNDNESKRIEKEETRQNNEVARINTEGTRIVEEELRKKAEQKREDNEDVRQRQEEQREQGTVEAILDAEKATDRLNDLSDHRDEIRDGYWWRWNETTGEWYNTNEIAKGNVMFATFWLDPSTGILTMYIDEEYTGPNFEITEKGELQVII